MERLLAAAGIAILLASSTACGGGDSAPAPIPDYAIESARASNDCMRSDGSGLPTQAPVVFGTVTAVPYPTPRGERVEAAFEVPALPGSREIDGFERDGWTTQVFEAETTEQALFDFYERALFERHLVMTGIGHGLAGRRCMFGPYWRSIDSPRVVISTEWVPYEERTPGDLPPGYQGKGVPVAPPAPGVLRYYVTTRN